VREIICEVGGWDMGVVVDVSLIQPSASSPNPCRKINVAGLDPCSGASMRWGGF
jgi:hypothetical protein